MIRPHRALWRARHFIYATVLSFALILMVTPPADNVCFGCGGIWHPAPESATNHITPHPFAGFADAIMLALVASILVILLGIGLLAVRRVVGLGRSAGYDDTEVETGTK